MKELIGLEVVPIRQKHNSRLVGFQVRRTYEYRFTLEHVEGVYHMIKSHAVKMHPLNKRQARRRATRAIRKLKVLIFQSEEQFKDE